jgi:hypothetical protein
MSEIPQIAVTPAAHLPISVERQQQIINGINAKLRANPRQGFCFMGRPGVGKTYIMRALQQAAIAAHTPGPMNRRIVTPRMFTLAEWQVARVRQVRGESAPLADGISTERIRELARYNEQTSEAYKMTGVYPFVTYHLFVDEFDSQPTSSEYAQSGLQSLVNSLYENAPRLVPGNDQDFCQLVVAMNKSWAEFEAAYGTHVARRIAEMCVRVDFDREAVFTSPQPESRALMPDAIDALFS